MHLGVVDGRRGGAERGIKEGMSWWCLEWNGLGRCTGKGEGLMYIPRDEKDNARLAACVSR